MEIAVLALFLCHSREMSCKIATYPHCLCAQFWSTKLSTFVPVKQFLDDSLLYHSALFCDTSARNCNELNSNKLWMYVSFICINFQRWKFLIFCECDWHAKDVLLFDCWLILFMWAILSYQNSQFSVTKMRCRENVWNFQAMRNGAEYLLSKYWFVI